MATAKSTVDGNRQKTGGRVKGTPNKSTKAVIERLEDLDCDPIEGMAKIARQAMGEGELAIAGQMYRELAQYIAPKRKAVEVSGPNGDSLLDGINEEELDERILSLLKQG